MSDKMIPTDGSPSQAAYEVFSKMFGAEMMTMWDTMLSGGYNAEVIASYAAGQIPDIAYNLQLSALRWREQELTAGSK